MNRYLFFTLSAALFLSLFGKLAWEIHKENTREAMNDLRVHDPYFTQELPPYVKQVYVITLQPTRDVNAQPVPVGKLIRELIRDGETNHTRLIVETYRFQPPGMALDNVGLYMQSQSSINDMIGLQNIEWDVFLRSNLSFLKLNLYYHMKAGPPSNNDMPIRSELKTAGPAWLALMSMMGNRVKLPEKIGDAPSQIVKAEDFQLAGICFSPFTQRSGIRLYDNWPVKYVKPEEIVQMAQNAKTSAESVFPYRLGRVIVTREVEANAPNSHEPVKAFEAVCELAQKVDDKADNETRLKALYLADGTVLQVDTEAMGYRLSARLEHIVENMSRIADPETGPDTAAHLFDRHRLYRDMFPATDIEEPGAELDPTGADLEANELQPPRPLGH